MSLGFLARRDPGDLSSMLITDFTMAETGVSHHLPQLVGALVMPVLAFLSLFWIDWRMATAMFVALPLALLILWSCTFVQNRLSGRQIAAKIHAGNCLEEYLQGIRVMKAYNLRGDIVFDKVSFAYQDKRVLHEVSLTFPCHSLTAWVGASGSGKSTLLKLCARFYDPQHGCVRLGGVSMRNLNPESLMSRISMVFQDVYLFQDTIRNNIRFGKPEATEEEVVSAARKVCCHDFIMRLPQGYDTPVGEGAARFRAVRSSAS